VFIPLGGSRVRVPRIYANLLVTMLVSGIWHGAGVNFIVWGLLHGIMLAVHRWWRGVRGDAVPTPARRIAAGVLTFVCVNLTWAFFCMDVKTALFFLKRLFVG
jgi:alginate O-acetyltransferase complex protein AlgI